MTRNKMLTSEGLPVVSRITLDRIVNRYFDSRKDLSTDIIVKSVILDMKEGNPHLLSYSNDLTERIVRLDQKNSRYNRPFLQAISLTGVYELLREEDGSKLPYVSQDTIRVFEIEKGRIHKENVKEWYNNLLANLAKTNKYVSLFIGHSVEELIRNKDLKAVTFAGAATSYELLRRQAQSNLLRKQITV